MAGWRRHDLVRVDPAAWPGMIAAVPRIGPVLAGWAGRGWPVVVRRRMPGDDPGALPVGVPLPPAEGKRRIGLCLSEDAVVDRLAPPGLAAVRKDVPANWSQAVSDLLGLAGGEGVAVRVFGSLMWQQLTGLAYLSADSDLDLLWPVAGPCDLGRLLDGMARIERRSQLRLDGEVVFADGGAVQWRELLQARGRPGPAEVLVKRLEGVALADLRHLGCAGAGA